MGFLGMKRDKRNKSNRGKDDSMTKESNKAVIAPTTNSNNKSSMREASKAQLSEEPVQIKDVDSELPTRRHKSEPPHSSPRASAIATEHTSGESKTLEPTDQHFRASTGGGKGPWFTSRSIKLFKKPPPADQAAYSGPPRYDWVDIVSTLLAAVVAVG